MSKFETIAHEVAVIGAHVVEYIGGEQPSITFDGITLSQQDLGEVTKAFVELATVLGITL